MKITMQQIADIAGVTRATVDKVVHNRPGVRPSTREHIQKILTEYGYQTSVIKNMVMPPHHSRIAVVTLPPSHDYYLEDLKTGMDNQLLLYKSSGLSAEYYYYNAADPETILSTVSYLEHEEIDALAIRGVDYPGVTSCIDRIASRKIPVITFDSDLPQSQRMCFVGEDLYQTGRISASLMGKLLNGHGEVAIVGSSLNTNSTAERFHGFLDCLTEEYPKIRVVAQLETLSQHAITYAKIREALTSYPNLGGIWNAVSCSEDIAQAIADARRTDLIKLVTLTFSPTVVSLIQQNKIDFTLGLAPKRIGELVIQTLYNYLYLGIHPESSHIKTPIHVALKENVDTFFQN